MNELRATGLNLDLSDEERQESARAVKDGFHKSMFLLLEWTSKNGEVSSTKIKT